MRDHRPQAALDLLEKGLAGQVRQRAFALSQLNDQVKALLPPHSAKHCRVANFRDGILIIECGSSTWANRLNFDRHVLLSSLRQSTLPSLMTIEIKVNPELAKREVEEIKAKEIKEKSSPVSPVAAEYLKAIAQSAPEKIRKKLEAIAALADKS
ncbi:DciA family protein [Enterovibrio sp. ZSDZ35]|uniref:DciA family protein n=1 Tax=Enterovibrio qingdaonensis TaxID=2899818 RepID=A0ABT5QN13_9GAMM|nr:DciA family protein [Enterovibrio sp. ZSDZ35]MDD1782269.1 DciA family protein [Enterovibrio sp. ZSDZ35]